MPPTSASTATAAAQYNHLAAASGANLYGPSSTPKNVSGHSGYGSSSKTYMNAPTPPSATAAPAPAPPPPASIGYLNSLTHIPESDSQLPLKSFLRLAESYRVKGQNQERANAIESAFVSYGIAAKYALERVPSHAEYGEKLTREQRQALERNAERILERLSTLKKAILERQEEYRRRYGEPQFDQPQSSRASASEAAQPQITPRFQLPPLPLPPYPVAPVQSRLQHTDHTSPSQFPPQVKIPPIPGIPLAPVQSRLQPTDHASPSHFQLPPYPVAPFRSRLHPSSHASKSIPKTTGISEDPQQPSVLPKPADRNEHPAYQPEPSSAYRPEPSAYRGKPSSYTLASNMPNVTVNQDEASPYTRTSDDANLPVEMIDQFALQLAMQEQQRLQPPTQLPSQSSVRDSTNAQEISHAEVTIPEHSNIPLQDRMDQYQESLDTWPPEDAEGRRRCLRKMMRLAKRSGIFPRSMYCSEVQLDNWESRGEGGYAYVYKGVYKGKAVAVKVLKPTIGRKETWQACAMEAFLWQQLAHPNILHCYGVNNELEIDRRSSVCLVFPWMPNGDLRHYIQDKVPFGYDDKFPLDALKDIARGLKYLHEHDPPIVHADIRCVRVWRLAYATLV